MLLPPAQRCSLALLSMTLQGCAGPKQECGGAGLISCCPYHPPVLFVSSTRWLAWDGTGTGHTQMTFLGWILEGSLGEGKARSGPWVADLEDWKGGVFASYYHQVSHGKTVSCSPCRQCTESPEVGKRASRDVRAAESPDVVGPTPSLGLSPRGWLECGAPLTGFVCMSRVVMLFHRTLVAAHQLMVQRVKPQACVSERKGLSGQGVPWSDPGLTHLLAFSGKGSVLHQDHGRAELRRGTAAWADQTRAASCITLMNIHARPLHLPLPHGESGAQSSRAGIGWGPRAVSPVWRSVFTLCVCACVRVCTCAHTLMLVRDSSYAVQA